MSCLNISPVCIVTEPVSPLETSPLSRPGDEQAVTVKQELIPADSPSVSEGKLLYVSMLCSDNWEAWRDRLHTKEHTRVSIKVKTTFDDTSKSSDTNFLYYCLL